MRKALPLNQRWMKSALTLLFLFGTILSVPAQTFSGLPGNACISDGPSTLNGSIAGGTFSGPGVSGSTFNPSTAGPGTHVITFSPPRYRVETITHTASSGTGTTIALADDASTGAIALGFAFNFFDINYTNTYISSNGFLSMVANPTNSSIVGNTALPSTVLPNNMIAFAMTDLDPGNGLQNIGANRLWYQRTGAAPNRVFTYNFRRVDQYQTGNLVTGKCVLREGSNIIEVHLAAKPNDASDCTEGIENANGTIAFTVPGRNSTQWTATNSAHRFVPQVAVTQTVIVNAHNSSLTCPANQVVPTDPGQCSAVANYTAPTVVDNCFLLRDPFNSTTNAALWQTIASGAVANSCGSPTGNHLYFNGTGIRSAQTFDFNTTGGGNITFNLDFGTGAAPCENADAGEDVVLEYSNNAGGTYTTIATYDTEVYINWNAVSAPIPVAARTASTRFRWRQLANSGLDFDNWGIDNVIVPTTPPPTQNGGLASGATFPLGVTTNNFSYTDAGGSTSNCSFTVRVNDNEAPAALCRNVTVALNGSGNASVTAGQINNGSNDNCGVQSIAVSPSSFNCGNIGSNTVTLTVTDNSTNSSNCTSTVTVEDNIAPNAICQPVTVQLNASGNASVTAGQVNNGSTDNCGITSSAVSPSAFTCSDIGSNTVTLTVNDASGNSDNCTATVTVEDNIAPNAICQPVTVQLNASGNASVTAGQVNNGSTDNCSIASVSVSPTNFNCSDVGSNAVTLTVTDGSGNAATCNANVTVEDNIAPNAVCQPVTVQLNPNGNASVTATQVNNGSTDNCGIASSSVSPTAFTCTNLGNNNVTLTVNDGSGNSDTCSTVVTVEDNLPPTANCSPVTVQLNAGGNGSITASDIDNNSTDNCGIASTTASVTAFSCTDIGNNNVTLTVNDGSGNSANCISVVTVEDAIAPTPVCQDVTVQLNANGNASVTAGQVNNGSTDNCSVANISVSPANFACSNVGSNTVTLTVSDSSGNAATCTANVTVEDNIAPVAVCQPVTVQLDAGGNATVAASQVDGGSTDNCTLASSTVVPSSFDCNDIGANTVTLTVTDVGGNTDNCTASVTVEDNVAPNAVCANITVQLNSNGAATIAAGDVDGGSTDNCGIDSLVASPTSFNCSNVGANSVILTVTDVNGNTSFCTATVTVEDTLPPVAVCQNDTVQLDNAGNATIVASDVDGGSTDNCSTVSNFVVSPASFTCADAGMNPVVLTVTDAGGNVDSCTAMVLVEDVLPPVAVCQGVTVQLDTAGNASTTASDLDGGSTDNCGIASISAAPTTFTCADLGMNPVLLTVTDSAGNADTCTAMVAVEDNVPPVATCLSDTFMLDSSGVLNLTGTDLDGGSFDNCSLASMTASPAIFGCSNLGTNMVTLTVTDGSGNSDSCTTMIVVEDVTPPTAVCQNITVQLNPNGIANITAADVDGGSTDNCAVDSMTVSPNSFFCFDAGNNTVVLTVSDGSGNSDACNAIVTVEDGTPPVANCQDATVQLDANGTGSITAFDINNGSTDNCGSPQTSLNLTTFTCVDLGPNAVVLTATDFGGNTDTCSATVTVIDVIPPVAVCQGVTVSLNPNGIGTIAAADIDGGSTDNCGVDSIVASPTSFTCADIGNNPVLLAVTDASGNLDTCSAIVVVEDTLAPNALCQNVTVSLDSNGVGSISATDIDAGSNDNCGIDTLFAGPTTFNCQGSNNQATLTVVDVNGNSSTCTALVQISDSIPPLAVCQNTIVYLDSMGMASFSAADLDGGSMDACGIDTLLVSPTNFGCSDISAPVSVLLTVIDAGGNADTCSAAVTVLDTIAPTIVCPGNTVIPAAPGQCSEQVVFVPNTFIDNCSGTFAQIDGTGLTTGSSFPVGVTLQSYTITDPSGNADTCVFTVTITDNEAPSISCPADTTVANDSAQCAAAITLPLGGATDNCGVDSVLNSFNGGSDASDTYPVGVTTVIFTASDTSGNLDTCSFVVTVLDTEAPTLVCPADTTVPADSVGCASAVNWTVATAFDNCGVDTLFSSVANGSAFPAGVSTVTYTALDASGNLDSCDFDITVVTAPLTASITAVTYSCGHNVSCNGDADGEATVTFGGGCGPYTILWSNGDVTATTSSLTAGTYMVTITDSLGASIMDSIVLTEPALLSITGMVAGTVCGNDATGSIDVTTSGGNDCSGGYSFSWNNGSTSEDLSGVPAGTYTLTATDLSGCSVSESFTIVSTPLPNPTVFKQGDTLLVNGSYQAYQWNRDGNVLSGATFAFYVPNQSGSFSVTVTDSNGCVGSSDTLFCQIVSAEAGLDEVFGIELFPNPTSGIVYLRTLKPLDRKVTITVMDIYGHTVKSYRLNGLRDTRELDLTDVANGMYILKLEDDKGGAASVRFMVE